MHIKNFLGGPDSGLSFNNHRSSLPMSKFSTETYASSLSAKLSTRSRHVCIFLGAGASCACGLPDAAGLEKKVLKRLGSKEKKQFQALLSGRNIEQVLSRLRRIGSLVTGDDMVDGLTADGALQLDEGLCEAMVNELSVDDASHVSLNAMKDFAAWLARTDYRQPVEIFTVNYDLLLERSMEELSVPYFDGFVGNLRARFRPDLVESTNNADARHSIPSLFVRLWKLHGSVNWIKDSGGGVVRLGRASEGRLPAAIYPSDTKYAESRRVPFLVLQDRFRRAMEYPESLVLISGYSFSDEHINEIIFNAASRHERSEYVAFCYGDIPDILKSKARVTPNLQVVGQKSAILGGLPGNWREPEGGRAPNWKDGGFSLPDFGGLAAYLARSSSLGVSYSDEEGSPPDA